MVARFTLNDWDVISQWFQGALLVKDGLNAKTRERWMMVAAKVETEKHRLEMLKNSKSNLVLVQEEDGGE